MSRQNWSGNVTFRAARLLRPRSIDELRAMVADSSPVRVFGSGHGFSEIADTTGDHLTMRGIPSTVDVSAAGAVVSAGQRYSDVAPHVHANGFAFRNLPSLPHIDVAGAISTGTHGSGGGVGNLATSVSALTFVRADGSLDTIERGDATFDGQVVALGTLGAITSLTLDVIPTFSLQQYVSEGLAFEAMLEGLEEIVASAYSVSVFTDWSGICSVWQKSVAVAPHIAGAIDADGERHPVAGFDPAECTPQQGLAGPWHERLPHFRFDFQPRVGEELQSEFFVPRSSSVDALRAVAGLADVVRPVLHVSEIRTVAADTLWLSPTYGQDRLAIHFTWKNDPAAVAPAVAAVERALAPFEARPHWGKVFSMPVVGLYPKLGEFVDLMATLDPSGKFRNAYVERLLLGVSAA
jgi:xylitol oxidase